MIGKRTIQGLIVIMLVASLARAQQAVELSLDQALQIGFDKSKGLHASLMRVQYADAKSGETNALLLPSLKFSGAYTRLSSVPSFEVNLPLPPPAPSHFVLSPAILDNYNLRLSVQQPLFTGWKVQSAVDAADYAAQATQKDYEKDKSGLVFNIKNAYWNLSKALELKKVVDENVEQIRAHVKDAQSWQSQGLVTNNDVLKVQVQLSEAQLRQIDAKNAVQLARITLNNIIGIPLDTEVILTTGLDHQPTTFPPLQDLVRQALAKRSDVEAMKYRVKAGESGVSLATSNWFPQLYLTGNYYFNRPNQRFQPMVDAFKNSWDLGIGMSIDIWNWGTTVHQTDQARAQLAEAQDGLSQLQDATTLEVTGNYLNLQRAQERIGVAREGVQQAEENYRITNNKFKQGLSVNTDLLDAEVALLQAKTNYTQALTDFEVAEASLARSVGD